MSFNPYFTGCFSFSLENKASMNSSKDCFNPYFTGCFSFSAGRPGTHGHHPAVSILILLDAFLLVANLWFTGRGDQSFNPYFTGCFSFSMWSGKATGPKETSFNPYFTGCFSFRPVYVSTGATTNGFQSLFYWMLFF